MFFMLELIIFISGAVVMIFEIAGSRIIAPYFGTSTVVWTSLIGVILGSLSLGYALGGRLADKNPSRRGLSLILLAASFLVSVTLFIKEPVLYFIQSAIYDIRLNGLISSLVLFAPASVCLGMVSPYIVRLRLKSLNESGKLVGNLYALGTVGSISGTFAAGFFIVPRLGSTKILLMLSLVLLILAVLSEGRNFFSRRKMLFSAFLIIFSFLSAAFSTVFLKSRGIIDIETEYSRYWILDGILNTETKERVRMLRTDPHGVQSSMHLDEGKKNELVLGYTEFFRLSDNFVPSPENALLIGGGAFSAASDFSQRHSDSKLQVVEIDPSLKDIAADYFGYKQDKNTIIHNMDGRVFINNYNGQLFDVVYLDAFNSKLAIPFQLTTVEAIGKISDIINDNGILIANIISAIEGDRSYFLQAELAVYNKIFPQVHIFPFEKEAP
jgi:predicted membrane-bound spermidine synthase